MLMTLQHSKMVFEPYFSHLADFRLTLALVFDLDLAKFGLLHHKMEDSFLNHQSTTYWPILSIIAVFAQFLC